jgi:hypothetical protein
MCHTLFDAAAAAAEPADGYAQHASDNLSDDQIYHVLPAVLQIKHVLCQTYEQPPLPPRRH